MIFRIQLSQVLNEAFKDYLNCNGECMIRSVLVTITVFLMFGCGKPIIILPGDKQSAVNKILKKVALNIKKETGLIPFGSGGQMMDQIKLLELFFLCHQPVNMKKGVNLY